MEWNGGFNSYNHQRALDCGIFCTGACLMVCPIWLLATGQSLIHVMVGWMMSSVKEFFGLKGEDGWGWVEREGGFRSEGIILVGRVH